MRPFRTGFIRRAALPLAAVLTLAGCSTEPEREIYDTRFVTVEHEAAAAEVAGEAPSAATSTEGATPAGSAAESVSEPTIGPTELRHDGTIRVMQATGFYAEQGGDRMLDLRFADRQALGLAVKLDGERWRCDYHFDLAEGYGRRRVTGSGTLDADAIEGTFRIEDERPDGRTVPVLEGRFEGVRSS